MADGNYGTPDWAPLYMQTLGSMFRAHPPIKPYRVEIASPDHPLMRDIEAFEATDEQYLMRSYGDLEVLLDTEFAGDAPGYAGAAALMQRQQPRQIGSRPFARKRKALNATKHKNLQKR